MSRDTLDLYRVVSCSIILHLHSNACVSLMMTSPDWPRTQCCFIRDEYTYLFYSCTRSGQTRWHYCWVTELNGSGMLRHMTFDPNIVAEPTSRVLHPYILSANARYMHHNCRLYSHHRRPWHRHTSSSFSSSWSGISVSHRLCTRDGFVYSSVPVPHDTTHFHYVHHHSLYQYKQNSEQIEFLRLWNTWRYASSHNIIAMLLLLQQTYIMYTWPFECPWKMTI